MARQPRTAVADTLEKVKAPRAKTFAGFVRQGDESGLTPCWGAIAKRFEQDFKGVAEREAIWRALVASGEKSALLLFVKHNLTQQGVLSKVVEDAKALPVQVQRVLACLDETRGLLEPRLGELSPEVQQLWTADEDTRRRERERFEARMSRLVALDYIVPDPPADTPKPPARRRPRA